VTKVILLVLQKVWKGTDENMSLQTSAETSQGRCGRDSAW